MTETQNLKLKKFEGTDGFDFNVLNENADVIDSVVSNPNLLDNPWFTVNQRIASGRLNEAYGFDRWYIKAICDGDKVSMQANDNIYQKFEESTLNRLFGKTITISVKVDGVVYSGSIDMPQTKPSDNGHRFIAIENDSFAVSIYTYSTANTSIFIVDAKSNIVVNACKIEYGTVSTLANDSVPDYALELEKCQRYFINGDISASYPNVNASGQGVIYFPTHMRVTPTISGMNAGSTAHVSPTCFAISGLNPNTIAGIVFKASADL